ncbi:NAD(P)H-hydrate dehydratase [Microbacterium sp. 179-B 1A2 NHS]|uniref:NAD(P)H-hydrate dehydratase n=1 Tax=Microbacterium sp. 179-B 1A2 NHS TaxID=3142383 RepID=UPI00399F9E89
MLSRAEPVTPALLRRQRLPDPGESKKSRGRVCVVGGSTRSPGAVMLAGEAALRVGAGMATLLVPEVLAIPIGTSFPEAGVHGMPEDSTAALDETVVRRLAGAGAVLVGPGLDDPELTRDRVRAVAEATDAPVLLDAYGLGVLPDIDRAALPDRLVLTPNREEAALLLGVAETDAGEGAVAEIARRYRATVSCYGLIADPRGRLWRVPRGGPGLGTSGSGDVLSGAIAGFLGRGVPPAEAAVWGTWVHTRAGNRLAARQGLGFIARDIVRELTPALGEIVGP